jgi:hypothetical protein
MVSGDAHMVAIDDGANNGHDWQGQELVSHELQIEVPR